MWHKQSGPGVVGTGPSPFAGQTSYKETKPSFGFLCYAIFWCNGTYLLFVLLVRLDLQYRAKWLSGKTSMIWLILVSCGTQNPRLSVLNYRRRAVLVGGSLLSRYCCRLAAWSPYVASSSGLSAWCWYEDGKYTDSAPYLKKRPNFWVAITLTHMNGFWYFLAEMLPIK